MTNVRDIGERQAVRALLFAPIAGLGAQPLLVEGEAFPYTSVEG